MSKPSIMERAMKATKNKLAAPINKSKVVGKSRICQMPVPMMNVALGGSFEGGLQKGILQIVGDSKHFKTAYAMVMASSFLKEKPDGVVIVFDSENGGIKSQAENFGVDTDRIFHIPVETVEQLKYEMMNQINEFTIEDDVMILVDSLGLLASNKEVADALDDKVVADMTRAKAINSLARCICSPVNIKGILCVIINHSYETMEMFSKTVVKGGKQMYLASDDIWIITRRQVTKGSGAKKELLGWEFVINIEKSREAREKSKIPITVTYDGGISEWSGLLDVAEQTGFIIKSKSGNANMYSRAFIEGDTPVRDTNKLEFWKPVLANENFREAVKQCYTLGNAPMLDFEIDE